MIHCRLLSKFTYDTRLTRMMYQLMLLHQDDARSSTRTMSLHQLHFQLMVTRHDTEVVDTTSARQLRDAYRARGSSVYDDDMRTLACTASLPRAHAATLFAQIPAALLSVFAATFLRIFTPGSDVPAACIERLADLDQLPSLDYTSQYITRSALCVSWLFSRHRAGSVVPGDPLPERDVRALTRNMRAVFTRLQREVAWLWEGDEILAETLRTRCGLSRNDSRSWLVDHDANFE